MDYSNVHSLTLPVEVLQQRIAQGIVVIAGDGLYLLYDETIESVPSGIDEADCTAIRRIVEILVEQRSNRVRNPVLWRRRSPNLR